MKFEVLTYGDSALRRKAEPVKKIDAAIRNLAKDMLKALYEAHGLGLAAEQVGRTEALCIVDVPAELDVKEKGGPRDNPAVPMPMVLINPRIIAEVGEQVGQEGCLSFPDIFVTIKRPEQITLAYQDTSNRDVTVTVRGLVARAVMHETDHLNGILLIDRMSTIQKLAAAAKLKRIKKATREKAREKKG